MKHLPSPSLENVVRGVAACLSVVLFLDLLQTRDLLGPGGLWPVGDFLADQLVAHGSRAYVEFPSVFWITASRRAIFAVGIFGAIVAALWAVFPRSIAFGMLAMVSWLSFVTVGGDFYQIIWDFYLTEAAWVALFTTFVVSTRAMSHHGWLRKLVIICWWLLVFRLWFSMGYVKITSPDPAWRELSYSFWFMQNQPMPAPLAILLRRAPMWFHTFATVIILFVELMLPFFIVFGRRARSIAFAGFALASIFIELTGNFGIFNLLSIATSFSLLVPFRYSHADRPTNAGANSADQTQLEATRDSSDQLSTCGLRLFSATIAIFIAAQIILQGLTLVHLSVPTQEPFQFLRIPAYDRGFLSAGHEETAAPSPRPGIARALWQLSAQWRFANPYGVFNSIARTRLEMRMSKECVPGTWSDVLFKYRPGHENESVGYYAPYYPRLDQMIAYESYDIPFHRFSPLNGSWNGQASPFPATLVDGIVHGADTHIRPLLKTLPCAGQSGRFRVELAAHRFSTLSGTTWDERVLEEVLLTGPSLHGASLHPMVPQMLLRFAMQDEGAIFEAQPTDPRSH